MPCMAQSEAPLGRSNRPTWHMFLHSDSATPSLMAMQGADLHVAVIDSAVPMHSKVAGESASNPTRPGTGNNESEPPLPPNAS